MTAPFDNAVKTSGLPQSESAIREKFDKTAKAEGFDFNNPSPFSPFWNLVRDLMILPAVWLTNFLRETILPQQFAMTATGGFLDLHAQTHGLTRRPAQKAQGNITFTRIPGEAVAVIPAGLEMMTPEIRGKIYRLQTLQGVVISPSEASADVLCEAMEPGAAYNLGAGYYSIANPRPDNIQSVSNRADWVTVPGRDAETDESLRIRIRATFEAASDFHTNARYRKIISDRSGISPDRIFFDPSRPRGWGSSDAVIVFDEFEPSQSYIDDLNTYINDEGMHGHGDDLLVRAADTYKVNLIVGIRFKPFIPVSGRADILSQIKDAVRCAFRENSDYKGRVTQTSSMGVFSMSRLSAELHALFPSILSIDFNVSDIITELSVARLSSLNVSEVPNG